MVKQDLMTDALEKQLTYETQVQFADRVKLTFLNFNKAVIDNIILSMNKRNDDIIKKKGQRIKY